MAKRVSYREIFFMHNGPGPWSCCFCNDLVSFEHIVIHHDDHDPSNNLPANLKAAHYSCHQRYHNSKRSPGYSRSIRISDEEHDRRSAASRMNWRDPVYRETVTNKKRGQTRTIEQRRRISEGTKMTMTPERIQAMSERTKRLWGDPAYRAKAGRPKGSKDRKPRKKRGE